MDVDDALEQAETWAALPDANEVAHVLAAEVRKLRAELELRRATIATGGPPPVFTETWENGPSSRPPTAPPEEIVVALPVSDEEFGELHYNVCDDCGRPHPAWIPCEAPTR